MYRCIIISPIFIIIVNIYVTFYFDLIQSQPNGARGVHQWQQWQRRRRRPPWIQGGLHAQLMTLRSQAFTIEALQKLLQRYHQTDNIFYLLPIAKKQHFCFYLLKLFLNVNYNVLESLDKDRKTNYFCQIFFSNIISLQLHTLFPTFLQLFLSNPKSRILEGPQNEHLFGR